MSIAEKQDGFHWVIVNFGQSNPLPLRPCCEKFNKVFLKIGIDFLEINAIIELFQKKRRKQMKIKELINELRKCNPNAEIFTESIEGFYAVTGVIDYNGDNETFIIKQEDFPTM